MIPLVEVVGGQQTASETIHWAMEFYQYWGKAPLHCRKEISEHLANRLQSVIANEAEQLVAKGIATTGEVDAVLTSGPGLRWALIGSFMTGHIAAGDGGLRDTLSGKFDAEAVLHESIGMDETLIDRIVKENQLQVAGRSPQEIEQIRDELLVGLLKLRANIKTKYGFDQGRFL